MSAQMKYVVLFAVTAVISASMFIFSGPIPQPVEYHNFADMRGWLGVPNFADVASNLPFTLFGLYGLWVMGKCIAVTRSTGSWLHDARLPLVVFFIAIVFVGPGSAYYHLEPNHDTLFWDRVPIVAGFMALTAAVIADRISPRMGAHIALPILVALGIALALHWKLTDDLRAYVLVQIVPALVIPLILWMWSNDASHGRVWITWRMIIWAMVWYGLAKVTEFSDVELFHALGETLSGHSIKHLLAAGVPLVVAISLDRRHQH
ncbi:hypothetical protein V5T82_11340 [Magnetovibrio sp. PR-2]|uniref:hypothetical protein n=1 Tax=Magnetovibrio sp. PR-2 TaxID=3120356 RepID=UPI002FCE2685